VTLADLFDGRSQLFVKHFMMGPGQVGQCVGCSLEVDYVEGALVHLRNDDVSYAVSARAPIEAIEPVRQRMGWRFTWVSSYHSDLNRDFHVSFRPDELAADRAFYNYEHGNPGLEVSRCDARRGKVRGRAVQHPRRLGATEEHVWQGRVGGRQRALPPTCLRLHGP